MIVSMWTFCVAGKQTKKKNRCFNVCPPAYGLSFEQAKSKCGQVTLLRAASMAARATACGQLTSVNIKYLSPLLGLEASAVHSGV